MMHISKTVEERLGKPSSFRQAASRTEEIAIALLLVLAGTMLLYFIETS